MGTAIAPDAGSRCSRQCMQRVREHDGDAIVGTNAGGPEGRCSDGAPAIELTVRRRRPRTAARADWVPSARSVRIWARFIGCGRGSAAGSARGRLFRRPGDGHGRRARLLLLANAAPASGFTLQFWTVPTHIESSWIPVVDLREVDLPTGVTRPLILVSSELLMPAA